MPTSFCRQCATDISEGDRFCAGCGASCNPGAPVGHHARRGTAASAASDVAQKGSQYSRYARNAKIVALIGFVLPWMTVSCSGDKVASASGLSLSFGLLSVRNPITGATDVHSGSPVLCILAALALIIVALAFFRKGRTGDIMANLICSAIALLLTFFGTFAAAIKAQEQGQSQGFQVHLQYGFWITCVALGAAVTFQWKRRRYAGITAPESSDSGFK
ncbi:MAG: hypothetical protein JWO65_1166 [Sphingomonas bacterium]|nr:hypothetical protein [Sphingomonas bacterium]